MTLLTTHRHELDRVASALVEHETLSLEDIQKVIKGEKLDPLELKDRNSFKTPIVPAKKTPVVTNSPVVLK
jgi:ATP-dependent metalloprotease